MKCEVFFKYDPGISQRQVLNFKLSVWQCTINAEDGFVKYLALLL